MTKTGCSGRFISATTRRKGKITKISVVSIFGGQELLNSDWINSDNYIIDVSHFQSGIYILTINSNSNLISKKLIIK